MSPGIGQELEEQRIGLAGARREEEPLGVDGMPRRWKSRATASRADCEAPGSVQVERERWGRPAPRGRPRAPARPTAVGLDSVRSRSVAPDSARRYATACGQAVRDAAPSGRVRRSGGSGRGSRAKAPPSWAFAPWRAQGTGLPRMACEGAW